MKHIPLPDEMPKAVELPDLPPQILHSTTVETLLQQNQDLMARLSIHLRRGVDLESSVNEKDETIKVLTYQKEMLSHEFELISEKFRKLTVNYEKMKADREHTEKRFAEFSVEQNSTQDRLQDENLLLRQVVRRYQKYRMRVRRLLRPAFKEKQRLEIETADQKQTLELLRQHLVRHKRYHFKILTRIRPWTKSLQTRVSDLSYHSYTLDKKIQDLQQELLILNQKLLDQRMQFEKDQTRLVEYHENRWQQAQELLTTRSEQLRLQTQRADLATDQLEKLRERQAEIENRAILAERTVKELEVKNKKSVDANHEHQDHLQRLLESSVRDLEELKVKELAAQKLNRKISEDMTELRKENELLRLRLRNAQAEAQKQIASIQQPQPAPVPGAARETQLLNRIEKILAGIQSGHSNIDFVPESSTRVQGQNKPSEFPLASESPIEQLLSERGDLEDLI